MLYCRPLRSNRAQAAKQRKANSLRAVREDTAPRVTPILGRFLFFLIAPCVLAGLVPWWITHWEFRVPFFGLEFARAIGMILIIAEWLGLWIRSRFALQGQARRRRLRQHGNS